MNTPVAAWPKKLYRKQYITVRMVESPACPSCHLHQRGFIEDPAVSFENAYLHTGNGHTSFHHRRTDQNVVFPLSESGDQFIAVFASAGTDSTVGKQLDDIETVSASVAKPCPHEARSMLIPISIRL